MGQGAVLSAPWVARVKEWANETPSVLDGPLEGALRMIARTIGADDPTGQVLGMVGAMETGPAGGIAGALGRLVERARVKNPIKAYHGSPHDFDQFSMEKIGTGEGAQAYGHGLYFAENERTAHEYRDALSDWAVEVGDRRITGGGRTYEGSLENQALAWVQDAKEHGSVDPFLTAEEWARRGLTHLDRDRAAAVTGKIAEWRRAGAKVANTKGRMYEVAIHADPEDFLDWDKPLSQQSEKVRKAIEGLPLSMRSRWEESGAWPHVRGRELYGELDKGRITNPVAPAAIRSPQPSADLKRAGILGIKYLDAGSRSAGEGTRNFVVFDDALIDILRKYGVAGAIGAGYTMQQIQQAQQGGQ